MSKCTRVLVANRPRFMRELIMDLFADEPDMEVVGELTESDFLDIESLVERTQPQFLILGLEKVGMCPPLCEGLLRRHPELKILAIANNNESSIFYWAELNVHWSAVETSQAGILEVLRSNRQIGRFM